MDVLYIFAVFCVAQRLDNSNRPHLLSELFQFAVISFAGSFGLPGLETFGFVQHDFDVWLFPLAYPL